MTHLVVRLVLAMLLLPVTGALFLILFASIVVPVGGNLGPGRILVVWALLYAFIGVYWVALWRSVVRWTGARVLMTALAVPGALVVGLFVGITFLSFLRGREFELALLVGGGVVPIAWVLATVLIWRETPRERMERISAAGTRTLSCPVCGYNMTGLSEARCPECGSKFTLDQLVAAQPERDKVLLRDE
jgi:hypothetical protein